MRVETSISLAMVTRRFKMTTDFGRFFLLDRFFLRLDFLDCLLSLSFLSFFFFFLSPLLDREVPSEDDEDELGSESEEEEAESELELELVLEPELGSSAGGVVATR